MRFILRRWLPRFVVLLLAAVTCGSMAWAQGVPSRFELGQRLRRLERVLETRNLVTDRAVVLPHLEGAVKAFFSMNPAQVAEHLDQAYVELLVLGAQESGKRSDLTMELEARARLVVRGDRFLQGAKPERLKFALSDLRGDASESDGAEDRRARAWLLDARGNVLLSKEVPLRVGAFEIELPKEWDAGDYQLRVLSRVDGLEVNVASMQVSWIPELDARLAKLDAQLKQHKDWDPDLRASIGFNADMLRRAYARQTSEMDLPAWRVLRQTESMVSGAGTGAWIAGLGEEFWLSLRGESEKGPKGRGYFRVFQPPREAGALRPCVIALHGAGGSENIFFDAYGDGLVRELCEQRGWVLIAPRCSFAGVGLPFQRVLESLQAPLGIDPARVFLVGHSMGVGAEAAALREARAPDAEGYRGVAAIGGGWGGLLGKNHMDTPFLVVTGSHDFARKPSQAAHDSLLEQGVKSRFLELPQVEHMGVVQFSLPEVFEFFDSCLGRQTGR